MEDGGEGVLSLLFRGFLHFTESPPSAPPKHYFLLFLGVDVYCSCESSKYLKMQRSPRLASTLTAGEAVSVKARRGGERSEASVATTPTRTNKKVRSRLD